MKLASANLAGIAFLMPNIIKEAARRWKEWLASLEAEGAENRKKNDQEQWDALSARSRKPSQGGASVEMAGGRSIEMAACSSSLPVLCSPDLQGTKKQVVSNTLFLASPFADTTATLKDERRTAGAGSLPGSKVSPVARAVQGREDPGVYEQRQPLMNTVTTVFFFVALGGVIGGAVGGVPGAVIGAVLGLLIGAKLAQIAARVRAEESEDTNKITTASRKSPLSSQSRTLFSHGPRPLGFAGGLAGAHLYTQSI